MWHWFKHKPEDYFTITEKQVIVAAIKQAEQTTNGEIRVYVESKCQYVKAIDRAKELFDKLDMHKTEEKNGVLVYIALKHRQLAIYADEGIYQKTQPNFWQSNMQTLIQHFHKEDYAHGIAAVVIAIGKLLQEHFPYNRKTDINELPDDIVFGN